MAKSPIDSLVAPLGFDSYAEYLNSPLWSGIRGRVYASKGRMCIRCKTRRATQIHHRQYDLPTLKGETLNYLVPVCRQCHREEHGREPIKPTKAPIVIPWNPKQRCPSNRPSKSTGGTKKGRDQYNAGRKQRKRAQRREKERERMTRPNAVTCKQCRDTVSLPPEIAWVDYICPRCKRREIEAARTMQARQSSREERERIEKAVNAVRSTAYTDRKTPTGALREFVNRARMS